MTAASAAEMLQVMDAVMAAEQVTSLSQSCAASGYAAAAALLDSVSVQRCAGQESNVSMAEVVGILTQAEVVNQDIGAKLANTQVAGEAGKTMLTNSSVHYIWLNSLDMLSGSALALDVSTLSDDATSRSTNFHLPASLTADVGGTGADSWSLHLCAHAGAPEIYGVAPLSPMVSISVSTAGVLSRAELSEPLSIT
eukprot:158277-Rhodomonas_salina.1